MSRESRFFGSRQWRSAGGLLRCLDNRPDERGDPAENRPAQYEMKQNRAKCSYATRSR
jgi:hypothetical protein